MAALGFFRKNQKMVFWIMVGLMVVFLLGVGGAKPIMDLFAPDPSSRALGMADGEDITGRDYQNAVRDLEFLGERLGLGDWRRMAMAKGIAAWASEYGFLDKEHLQRVQANYPVYRGDHEFLSVLANPDPQMVWLLLGREARKMGFEASDQMIDEFLTGVREEKLTGFSKAEVRRAVGTYLTILEAFDAVAAGTFMPEPELRRKYRDIYYRMDLGLVEFRAEDFLSLVQAKPTDDDIRELFEECKGDFRDSPTCKSKLGFGYRRPQEVQLEYIFVDLDELTDTANPSDEEMWDYWEKNKGTITKQVPEPAATQPTSQTATQSATQSATQPASQPTTRYATVTVTQYSEAKPLIRERLRPDVASREMEDVVRQLTAAINRHIEAGEDSTTNPQRGALALAAEDMGKVKVHHVYSGRAMGREAVNKDPILGSAGNELGRLSDVVFSLEQLGVKSPLATVGKVITPPMTVAGDRRGKLICRVVAAWPDRVPEGMEAVRRQLEEDWNTARAYTLAVTRAKDIRDKAVREGLDAATKGLDKEVVTANAISRVKFMPSWSASIIPQLLGQQVRMAMVGQAVELPDALGRFCVEALLAEPYQEVPSFLPRVDDNQRKTFLDALFAEPAGAATRPAATQPTDFPTTAPAPADEVRVIEVPGQRAVFVVQRVRIIPPYEDDYRARRAGLLYGFSDNRQSWIRKNWFSQDNVLKRTGFVPAEKDD